MNHLMIDLETMGNNPDAPIIAIGAVFFNPLTAVTGAEYYASVSLSSEMELGAKPDAGTIIWWMKQSQAARAAVCDNKSVSISLALLELNKFIAKNSPNSRHMKVWGNGSSFDNVILRQSFKRTNLEFPSPFWNDSDVRTIVMLGREIGFEPKRDMTLEGVAHNALADARHQVKYVSAIWQRLLPLPASADYRSN